MERSSGNSIDLKRAVFDVIDALSPYVVIYAFAMVVYNASPLGRDDSDSRDWSFGKSGRSGMAVRTDALTGCQYLEGSGGGMIRRTDASGRHIGCR